MTTHSPHPLLWVDAFTTTLFGGNPCAVVFEADGLDDAQMLAFAREFNLSETAFVSRSACADFRARYFTPEREIPLAGHPTIATVHALIETRRFKLKGLADRLTLELRDGPVAIELATLGNGSLSIVMVQRKPQFLKCHDRAKVAAIFGLTPDELISEVPIQTVSTGTPFLMVPLKSQHSLRKAALNTPAYNELRTNGDFFSPHLFCLQGATPAGTTFARHLGTPPDTLEDPFTGSATGCMGAYLWKYGLISAPTFIAEQGHWMGRPGVATVEVVGTQENPDTVKVGGQAVTVFSGTTGATRA